MKILSITALGLISIVAGTVAEAAPPFSKTMVGGGYGPTLASCAVSPSTFTSWQSPNGSLSFKVPNNAG